MHRCTYMGWMVGVCMMLVGAPLTAAPPPPSGPHPRMFLDGDNLDRARAAAAIEGSASSHMIELCQQTIDQPGDFESRGGVDGNTWPAAAVACAFAYLVTEDADYAAQAIIYWNASLEDDFDIGDGLGCVAGVDTSWEDWEGSPPAPPVIITVTHDTGYPMRWYGPFIALTYDWLHDAPGVDEALRAHTRTCLTEWVAYYSDRGYLRDVPGANYNAGFVAGKALAAVALAGDSADGDRLWAEAVDEVFAEVLIGNGLAGSDAALGEWAGALVGGDWGEGWQYGPLSVLEYAAAARILEEQGAPLPAMREWTNSLIVRYVHGHVPTFDAQYVGGDFDFEEPYQSPTRNQLDAVLLGPSSQEAAGWAMGMLERQDIPRSDFIWNALAETREVDPEDYLGQDPEPARWYVARGTRNMYVRTSWQEDAYWAVFSSPPQIVPDHHHHAAGNFVFSRGADHLIVDPSNYGEMGTLETNAVAADSPGVLGDYAPSQTPWSEAELVWARGTEDAVYAARSDFAEAFRYADADSDIPYATRDWVLLPEGEIVVIDRVHTADADHAMHLNFHANTGGTLVLGGDGASGTVGDSEVVIHRVLPVSGEAEVFQPEVVNNYEYPCGDCTNARFLVDNYAMSIPGPWAVGIHVIDGLAAGEDAAIVASLNDDAVDPAPKQNEGVIGAAVYRGERQSYVIASSGVDGQVGAEMSYGVPGDGASRHVVFDAPANGDGQSVVTAVAEDGRCLVSIAAGAGFAGRPLMFAVAAAADGCTVTEETDVPPAPAPEDDGGPDGDGGGDSGGGNDVGPGPGSDGGGSADAGDAGTGQTSGGDDGCGCASAGGQPALGGLPLVLACWVALRRPRRRTLVSACVLVAALITACDENGDSRGDTGDTSTLGDATNDSDSAVIDAPETDADVADGDIVDADGGAASDGGGDPDLLPDVPLPDGGPEHPNAEGGRRVDMVAPVGGESFLAPASLRLIASGRDPNVFTNEPTEGHGGNAARVQFFVDDELVLEVDGLDAEYWIFKGFADGIEAGPHQVWARAIYVEPDLVLDSLPVIIQVDAPTYAQVIDLEADVVLSGSADYTVSGSAEGRIRIDGNGFQIRSDDGYSGDLTLAFVDVVGLGDPTDTAAAGIDVTTTGAVAITHSVFDGGNPVRIAANGAAAMIRDNVFRSNMRMPIGQFPDPSFGGGPTYPVLELGGSGAGPRVFAGNNVGASYVDFGGTRWTIGGDGAEDANVLIGARVGIHLATDADVRGNYSHHIYYGGWSQGANFELGGDAGGVVEHNVIIGSSWPVRGVAGEFRYNLVLEAGHQWLWADSDGAAIHHNVFIGGEGDVGGIYVLYEPEDVRIYNNTIDGLDVIGRAITMENGAVELSSNLLYRVQSPAVTIDGGTLEADYNLFFGPDDAYSDGTSPAHDVTIDPALADPVDAAVAFDEVGVWQRTVTVPEILGAYRDRYTPEEGSAAIDAGDPAGGSGNDIGAVGAGESNAADLFGRQ